MLARLKNWLKLLLWKIRVHNPEEIEMEILTDDVGEQFLCVKAKEGRAYDVLVVSRDDAEGLAETYLKEARSHGWLRPDE